MSETKIEWTATVLPDGTTIPGYSFNPWVGCLKVSPGCDHCYAESWAKRSGMVEWGAARRRTSPAYWHKLVKLHRAIPDGQRRRVFCASLADVFDNEVPPEWRADLFSLISATPRFDWLLLTKRIGNVKSMVPWYSYRGSMEPQYFCPPNVWLGISVVNQVEADRDIPKLLATPAAIRFLSIEPMLGPVDLTGVRHSLGGESFEIASVLEADDGFGLNAPRNRIDWVICGGESGHGARPMEADWARSLKVQCAAAGVAFFFKQGSQANWPDYKNFESFPPSLQVRQWPI
jgi:protein gp37